MNPRPPPRIRVRIVPDAIDEREMIEYVRDARAGAISVFVGTTRDDFNGRKVLRLSYECYEAMAVETLRAIALEMCAKYAGDGDESNANRVDGRGGRGVVAFDIAHRVGNVAAGETSVVIACAASHRKDACDAVAEAMEGLKARVPIWKKEILEAAEGEEGVWKANATGTLFGRDDDADGTR